MPRVKWRRYLWAAAQSAFVAAVLFFLVRTLAMRWSAVIAFQWHFRLLPMLASFALQLGATLFWASVWRYMLVRSGNLLEWADGVKIYVVSNLAKYIPGSIWGYVSRVYLGREQGVTPANVGLTVVWEVGLTVVASLILTVVTLQYYLQEIPISYFRLVAGVAFLCAGALIPPIFKRWVRLVQRWGMWKNCPPFSWSDFFLYLGAAFLTHIIVGTAFFFFAAALMDVAWSQWALFVGIWSFSATAGLVFVLAPYGIGIKESLLAVLLARILPMETATLLALASRLWTILGELGIVVVVLLVLKKRV